MTRIKICGLTHRDDAMLALELGADALGFVLEPSSPRFLGEEVPKWVNELPPLPAKVAVFGVVRRPVHLSAFDLVQGAEWEVLAVPAPKRIHTLRIRPGQKADDFVQQSVNASALLLDAHKDGQYGGTGTRIDWDLAAEIASVSQWSVRAVKKMIRGLQAGWREDGPEAEALFLEGFANPDFAEGVRAFLDKRPADWKVK